MNFRLFFCEYKLNYYLNKNNKKYKQFNKYKSCLTTRFLILIFKRSYMKIKTF